MCCFLYGDAATFVLVASMCCRRSASTQPPTFRCCWLIEGMVQEPAGVAAEVEAAVAEEVGSAALEAAPAAEPYVAPTAAAVELAGC